MNEFFLRDLDLVANGERPLFLAMNTEWPYGDNEKRTYDRLLALMDKNGISPEDYRSVLEEYKSSMSK